MLSVTSISSSDSSNNSWGQYYYHPYLTEEKTDINETNYVCKDTQLVNSSAGVQIHQISKSVSYWLPKNLYLCLTQIKKLPKTIPFNSLLEERIHIRKMVDVCISVQVIVRD